MWQPHVACRCCCAAAPHGAQVGVADSGGGQGGERRGPARQGGARPAAGADRGLPLSARAAAAASNRLVHFALKYWLAMTGTVIAIQAIMWKVKRLNAAASVCPRRLLTGPSCCCLWIDRPCAPPCPSAFCQAIPDGAGPLQDAQDQINFFLKAQPIYASITVAICLQDTVSVMSPLPLATARFSASPLCPGCKCRL